MVCWRQRPISGHWTTIEAPERARLKAPGRRGVHARRRPAGLPYLEAAVLELNPDEQPTSCWLWLGPAWADINTTQPPTDRLSNTWTAPQARLKQPERRGAGIGAKLPRQRLPAYGPIHEADRWAVLLSNWAKTRFAVGRVAGLRVSVRECAMNRYWDECIRYARLNHDIGQRIGALDRGRVGRLSPERCLVRKGRPSGSAGWPSKRWKWRNGIGEARLSTWLDATSGACLYRPGQSGLSPNSICAAGLNGLMHWDNWRSDVSTSVLGHTYMPRRDGSCRHLRSVVRVMRDPQTNRMGCWTAVPTMLSLLRTGRLARPKPARQFETLAVNAEGCIRWLRRGYVRSGPG